jgi:hypothetical protein
VGRARPGTADVQELELGEDVIGGGRSVRGLKVGIVAIGRHGDVPCRNGRAHRGLLAITWRRADRACTAERSDSGRSAAEDGGRQLFCFVMQSRRSRDCAAKPRARVASGGGK